MEYHLLWEIPAGLILLIASFYCGYNSDSNELLDD